MGYTRMMDRFPMTRAAFAIRFFASILWPPRLLCYMWQTLSISTLGVCANPYQDPADRQPHLGKLRLTTVLGMAWLALMVVVTGYLSYFGSWSSLVLTPLALWGAAAAVVACLPESWFFRSKLRPVISSKLTSIMRLGWFTLLECAVAWLRLATGVDWGVYVWLLWILPLLTSFPYFMLLRDLFQHANADSGKLTNSRVIVCNPLVRWAMFVYGQDLHLPHHMFPAVPHYNLNRLHRLLAEHQHDYAQSVVECDGVLWNSSGRPTALDCMADPAPLAAPR
jgi:hypothetical protein